MIRFLLFVFTTFAFFLPNLKAQEVNFWGMTSTGGACNSGTIFKTDSNGENGVLVYSLKDYDGANPRESELCEASNGKLYGVTRYGGANNKGVIFEYDPSNGSYTKKIDFDGINTGEEMFGSLIQASNGKLYGMTKEGGPSGFGIIFEYNPISNVFVRKVNFDDTEKGKGPLGSLMQANNEKLYGMTQFGGEHDDGVIFEYDISTNTFITKIDFDYSNGANPAGSIIQADDGFLYGMTAGGGGYSRGVLFKYDPSNGDYSRVAFNHVLGMGPRGSLIQASDGNLYGTAIRGGSNDKGILFEYDIVDRTLSNRVSFSDELGRYPYGSLIQSINGELYGTTSQGGEYGNGVLFEYDLTGDVYTKKVDFDGAEGSTPLGALIQAANGKLYGMTNKGGESDDGVLFAFNPNSDTYSKMVDFNVHDGILPWGSLVKASNGKFYGMGHSGGANDNGVVFEYDQVGEIYTIKVDFDANTGRYPSGSLIQASNGKLYGMNQNGGANLGGVLFEYDPINDVFTNKVDFDDEMTGKFPNGSLIQASNGNLYGMTYSGGEYDKGALFEYDIIIDEILIIVDFDGTTKGQNPNGSLIQALNSKLYGMTKSGGANNKGVIFEYDLTMDEYTKKIDFDGTNGSNPLGTLMQASNGNLYGMTYDGGTNDKGVLFKYSGDSYSKIIDFDGLNMGQSPRGSLMQASNGNIYGMTGSGGAHSKGVLFEVNPENDNYTNKIDFSYGSGAYGALIEAFYDPFVWTGTGNSDWNDAGNWFGNIVPTVSDNVTIENAGEAPVIASGIPADCNNLTINSSAMLTVESGASLINNGIITNNGTIKIDRTITDGEWHLFSAPNNSTIANTFLGDYLQNWNETSATWSEILDINTPLNVGEGYSLWGVSKATTYTFTGTPNTGEILIPITYTDNCDEGVCHDGSNLIGNPYPSSIDWDSMDETWGAVYVWNPNFDNGNGTFGKYIYWVNGTGTYGGSQYIAPMQGFFIVAESEDDGNNLTLNNVNRTHGGANSFYKSENSIQNGLIIAAFTNNAADEVCIKIQSNATTGFDKTFDAYKFLSNIGGVSELYSISGDKFLSIDSRPETGLIQLGYRNSQNGTYRIGIQEIEGIAKAELEDTKHNRFHDLRQGAYEFDWITSDFEDRFVLHLSATGIEDLKEQNAQVYSSNRQVYVRLNDVDKFNQILIYNVAGQMVLNNTLSKLSLQKFELNQMKGAFFVELKGENNSFVQKVIL